MCIVAASAFILVFIVSGLEAQHVHFNQTSGDCSDNSTVVRECESLYSGALYQAYLGGYYTTQLECIVMVETIACIETALCHCDFSPDHPQLEAGYRTSMVLYHYYNNLTDCVNLASGDNIQGDVIGAIDVTEGVNCSAYNRTAGDLSLSLAVSQFQDIQEAEALCAGIQSCFEQFDRDLEMSLFRKDWPGYCMDTEDLLQCLVNASCTCGQSTHALVVSLVNVERDYYNKTCATIIPSAAQYKVIIECPGLEICETDVPQYNCLAEFEATANAASYAQYCTALYDLANCTEELACDCGFYQEPGYYTSLAIARHNYEVVYFCQNLTGRFPNHTDLNCGVDDRFTDEEKILSVSLAEPAFVEQEEARCPGIRTCFEVANAQSTLGHRLKDLTAICQAESQRLVCVGQAYCDCGLLHDTNVSTRLYQERRNQGYLCYSATEFPPLTRCRGVATCQHSDPIRICEVEYGDDFALANSNELMCQASKRYITCVEQVGCACGLLDDGTSLEAQVVYNMSTLSLQIYDEFGCPDLTGRIFPEDDGIECADQPDNSTRKKLVLSYADSSEVEALSMDCKTVHACFQTHDQEKGRALLGRNYTQLCLVQSALIDCVELAYCRCALNGTDIAERYIETQIISHQTLCANVNTHKRKGCNTETSAAGDHSVYLGLLTVTLLTSFIVMTSHVFV